MENNWGKRSKRYRDAHMGALGALYGDNVSPPMPMPTPKPKRVVKRKRSTVERDMQIKLVGWIRHDLGLPVFSIPNEGKRSPWLTELLKAMGLTPGASDLCLPVSRGGHGCFFIELKEPGKKPRDNQIAFLLSMRAQGHKAEWYDNLDIAKQAIHHYLNIGTVYA